MKNEFSTIETTTMKTIDTKHLDTITGGQAPTAIPLPWPVWPPKAPWEPRPNLPPTIA